MSGPLSRRSFLQLALAGAGAAGCGQLGGSPLAPQRRLARRSGALWGEAPADWRSALLPGDRTPQAMLEVFLLGGMSPWESFYCVPEFGEPARGGPFAGQQWWMYQDTGPLTVPAWWEQCGRGAGQPLLVPWATDGRGLHVNMGPFVHVLRDRPDMVARMRVWVMSHPFEPHEGATPLAMTGQGRGNPRGASLGAHLERYFQDRASADRGAPHSYTLFMSSFDANAGNNGDTATAVGFHRASSRPMALYTGRSQRLSDQLRRPTVEGYRAALDRMVSFYGDRFDARLRRPGGARVRAPGFADFTFGHTLLERHAVLQGLLPDSLMQTRSAEVCWSPGYAAMLSGVRDDETTTSLDLARHLLVSERDSARYVQVVESGIYLDKEGMGYDSHSDHVEQQGTNLTHMLRALEARVNRPGEQDPSKLDLDRHFILLNTEFGRAPYPEHSYANPSGSGSNHWPFGYVVVGFGGFVGPEQAGIVGAIGEDGRALDSLTPAEHRAAMLLAMGIWPFSEEAFAVGDVRAGTTELDSALWLREHVLGYPG